MASLSTTPFPLTNDPLIDAATNGFIWQLDNTKTIRWGVANGFDGEIWSNPNNAAANLDQIFNTISFYANVKFSYAGTFTNPAIAASSADIVFAPSNSTILFPKQTIWGATIMPILRLSTAYTGANGDIYVNTESEAANLPSYAPGSAGYFLFLHELGHALGLKHPHDDGGTGRPTLAALGLEAIDRDWFSMMSYQDEQPLNDLDWDPATPMALDVLGLQYLYGANMSSNAGDTLYTLPLTNLYATFWDAGGMDAIDVSDATVAWTIDLPFLQMSRLVPTLVGFAGPSAELASGLHTFYWLLGDIENVTGSRFGDRLTGSRDDNIMRGNGGNDVIDGDEGLDTAVYSSRRGDYTLTATADGFSVNDKTGLDGTDSVANVERFRFSDTSIAFDIEGNAGQAYRLYQAAFDRQPDLPGLGWQIRAMDAGVSLQQIAANFVGSAEFQSLYGSNPTNAALVTQLYQNVLHREPETAGYAHWLGILDRNELSRGDVLYYFSESAENKAQVVGSIQGGIEYTYYA